MKPTRLAKLVNAHPARAPAAPAALVARPGADSAAAVVALGAVPLACTPFGMTGDSTVSG